MPRANTRPPPVRTPTSGLAHACCSARPAPWCGGGGSCGCCAGHVYHTIPAMAAAIPAQHAKSDDEHGLQVAGHVVHTSALRGVKRGQTRVVLIVLRCGATTHAASAPSSCICPTRPNGSISGIRAPSSATAIGDTCAGDVERAAVGRSMSGGLARLLRLAHAGSTAH